MPVPQSAPPPPSPLGSYLPTHRLSGETVLCCRRLGALEVMKTLIPAMAVVSNFVGHVTPPPMIAFTLICNWLTISSTMLPHRLALNRYHLLARSRPPSSPSLGPTPDHPTLSSCLTSCASTLTLTKTSRPFGRRILLSGSPAQTLLSISSKMDLPANTSFLTASLLPLL